MKFSVVWCMPNKWTFKIPPIKRFVERHIPKNGIIVDPFSGSSNYATFSNDLGEGGVDALEFLLGLEKKKVVADCVLFDPPYSPRQMKECYVKIGRKTKKEDFQNSSLYRETKEVLRRLLRDGGMCLSFGWTTSGLFPNEKTVEILAV